MIYIAPKSEWTESNRLSAVVSQLRIVHTADAIQLDSWVAPASAVCIGQSEGRSVRDGYRPLVVRDRQRLLCRLSQDTAVELTSAGLPENWLSTIKQSNQIYIAISQANQRRRARVGGARRSVHVQITAIDATHKFTLRCMQQEYCTNR